MEHIEGETLADRLKKGALPVQPAIRHAIEIADALDKAHHQGVVHRDLKPGNIMLTKSGAKLLDFGLAKLRQSGSLGGPGLSSLATEAKPLTEKGAILGTFQYMAPEQLEGKEADARTDIFAFGAVLYEMVTGRRAFEGKSQASLISAIMSSDPPPVTTLQTMTPPALDHVVRMCFAKDPDERWQTAHDLTAQLNWIAEAGSQPSVTSPVIARRRVSSRLAAGLLGSMIGALLASIVVWNLKPTAPAGRTVTRFRMGLQSAEEIGGFRHGSIVAGWRPSRTVITFSPDGRHLVYRGGVDDTWQLYLRPMDQADASPMPGTEGAVGPFFSPDGQWVGFWANGELRKVRLTGGPPATVCEAPLVFGASWGEDDTIVFAHGEGGLWSVSADGGTPKELTTLGEGEVSHRLPEVLPGAQAVVFTITKRFWYWKDTELAVQVLATGERKVLVEGAADPRYVPTGHLLYARLGTLMAVPFDLERLEVTGGSLPVIEGVMQAVYAINSGIDTGAAQFSVSGAGSLVYIQGGVAPPDRKSFVWVDREGRARPLGGTERGYWYPRLSPDGRRVAVNITEPEQLDILVYDISRGTLTRVTQEGVNDYPAWSPDGKRVAFQSTTSGPANLFWVQPDGSALERLTTSENKQTPASWSPDGKVLAFIEDSPTTGSDIWVLTFDNGEHEPRPVVQTRFEEEYPAFSPDGRWLAYVSDESGRGEVYVQPYPGPGTRTQISAEGGRSPAWARDGRELFYRIFSRGKIKMMAVNISTDAPFTAGTPRMLFDESRYQPSSPLRSYDVAADGRFLMLERVEQPTERVTELRVVLNWFEELKRLVPADN